jgi:hypothetical protein
MALSVLFFPEGRTLVLAEEDPYRLGAARAWYASSRHAAAAYDPAFVVPCGTALLRSGQLTARSAVSTGWLFLLLRSLGSRDAALRCDQQPAYLSSEENTFQQCMIRTHGTKPRSSIVTQSCEFQFSVKVSKLSSYLQSEFTP